MQSGKLDKIFKTGRTAMVLGNPTQIGMVQLPPAMVSAPFKLLLFVLVDGWNLTIGSLMKGFFFA